jgi:hypothetical protein
VQALFCFFREPFTAGSVYPYVRREASKAPRNKHEAFERIMTAIDYQYLSELQKAGHQSGERAKGLPAHPLRL